MRFFLDNCLPPQVAKALQALDQVHQIAHLRDKFEENVKDPFWIGELAKEHDWVIVSGDARIPKSPQNREAWRRSSLTGFFLKGAWGHQRLWDQAWRLIQWWPTITTTAENIKLKPGQGYWVPLNFGRKADKLELIV